MQSTQIKQMEKVLKFSILEFSKLCEDSVRDASIGRKSTYGILN